MCLKDHILLLVFKNIELFTGPIWESISDQAKSFINKMLEYDPKKRITAKQALNDPWISFNTSKATNNIEDLYISLQHLTSFKARSSLHKAVLTYMAGRTLTKRKEKKLRNIFREIDKNDDGQLSKPELIEAFTKFHGDNQLAVKDVENLMKRVDFNKNGMIDYNGMFYSKI
jgi:calcium-dependent protein kinase